MNNYTPPPYIPLITPTEWKYLYYRLLGYDSFEIGTEVGRNYSTVKNVIRQVRFKMSNAGSMRINHIDLVCYLRNMGFVDDTGRVVDDRFMRMKYKEIFPERLPE